LAERRAADAQAALRQAIELRREMAKENLGRLGERGDLALNHLQMAVILHWLGDPAQCESELRTAQAELEQLVSVDESSGPTAAFLIDVRRRLGNLLVAQSRLEEAQAVYLQLQNSTVATPAAKDALAWHLATCPLAAYREPTRAVELSRSATEAVPWEGQYWTTCGAALYRAGSLPEAALALEKARQLLADRNDPTPLYFLAMVHWEQGDQEQARRSFVRAESAGDQIHGWSIDAERLRHETGELIGAPVTPSAEPQAPNGQRGSGD
jgi:tetratricopeptide (TPR) repeat protein